MDFLNLLFKSKPSYRKKLLEQAPKEIIDLLAKGALNILQGKILITKKQFKKMKPYKISLRQLADPKVSTKRKRAILQKGGKGGLINIHGFIPTLLKGINLGYNTVHKILPGGKPMTDMEAKDYHTMVDNIVKDPVKFYQISHEMDRKKADGTYDVLDAIRKNPVPFKQTYLDLKKEGKI